jgi:hypothetical protein
MAGKGTILDISYGENLTNGTKGGDGSPAGWRHKKEAVDKIIIALKQRSKESRRIAAAKASIKLTGGHATEIAKKRLSDSHIEFWKSLSDEDKKLRIGGLRRVWTDEDKNRASETCTGLKHELATSKYRGVSWFKRDGRWRAWLHYNGKQLHLGYFDNEIDAAHAFDQRVRELRGDFARLNFPDNSVCEI